MPGKLQEHELTHSPKPAETTATVERRTQRRGYPPAAGQPRRLHSVKALAKEAKQTRSVHARRGRRVKLPLSFVDFSTQAITHSQDRLIEPDDDVV